ncbi:hypothetical protein Tco_1446374 [Tanacetum coccineum]
MFKIVNLQCLYDINEHICPRFLLEFYSQVELIRNDDQTLYLKFWALEIPFTITLEHLSHIFNIPTRGQCAYSAECSLESLTVNRETDGPYQTYIPTPNEIKYFITTNLNKVKNPIAELRQNMRSWEEIFWQNVLSPGENSNHLLASSCHMIDCWMTKQPYNLTYFIAKRIANVKNYPNTPIHYSMLLTRLYIYIKSIHQHFEKPKYQLFRHVMGLIGDYDDYFDSDSEPTNEDESDD